MSAGLAGHGGAPASLDLVGDVAVAHREDLKATGVGDDRVLPAHEAIQAAELGDQLGARGEEEMERVAEHHLVAERAQVAGLERLDRATGRQRDERGRLHVAVGEAQGARRARLSEHRVRTVNTARTLLSQRLQTVITPRPACRPRSRSARRRRSARRWRSQAWRPRSGPCAGPAARAWGRSPRARRDQSSP